MPCCSLLPITHIYACRTRAPSSLNHSSTCYLLSVFLLAFTFTPSIDSVFDSVLIPSLNHPLPFSIEDWSVAQGLLPSPFFHPGLRISGIWFTTLRSTFISAHPEDPGLSCFDLQISHGLHSLLRKIGDLRAAFK